MNIHTFSIEETGKNIQYHINKQTMYYIYKHKQTNKHMNKKWIPPQRPTVHLAAQ